MRAQLNDSEQWADNAGMSGVRAFLLAFAGSFAWFWWTATHQSTGACFTYTHYAPSACAALAVITGLSVGVEALIALTADDPGSRERWSSFLPRKAAAPILLASGGLAAATFFAAVVSCTGG